MKTVCLYFQVHQPWRLKKYRFFNMGKDHNYLDDLLNRSIMQKVARQCYLPMNALLLKLIKENKGKFRCSFSITGIAVEQFRAFAPEVLDSFKELRDLTAYDELELDTLGEKKTALFVIISDTDATFNFIVKELLAKLAEYKPLAKIEEIEEQNYNMIDDRLNNGVEKFNREEEKKEQAENRRLVFP